MIEVKFPLFLMTHMLLTNMILSFFKCISRHESSSTWSNVFCFGEFSQPSDKEIGLTNPKKGFLNFFLKNRHILTKKALKSRYLDNVFL
jgi:hypothetical protein